MIRSLRYAALLSVLAFVTSAMPQKSTEPTVSGPAQENPSTPTGKSYKKGSKRKDIKEKNPSTGQTRRLGNTGRLTKDKGASGSTNKSDDASKPK